MNWISSIYPDWKWGVIPLAIAFAPLIFLGDHAYLTVPDGLESEFISLSLLKNNDALFLESNAIIEEPMGGLRSDQFHSAINFNRVVFWLLPSVKAYGFLLLFYRIIAFWGCWLLLKELAIRRNVPIGWGEVLVALGFSTIFSYNLYGLSSLGLPLLIASLLRLFRFPSEKWPWFVFALFGIFSHLAMVLLATVSIWLFALTFKCWKFDRKGIITVIASGCFLVVGMMVANYQTIFGLLIEGEVPHRVERLISANLSEGWGWTRYNLLHGHYHSGAFPGRFILLTGVLVAILDYWTKGNRKLILPVLAYAVVGFLFHSAKPFTSWAEINFFHQFDLQRIHFLWPLLAVAIGSGVAQFGRVFMIPWGICWLILCLSSNNEIRSNWKQTLLQRGAETLYFDRLVATTEWKELQNEISFKDVRVGMCGIPPWTAQYNGLHTIGGYQNLYPLSYKHKYRKVLESEFLSSPSMMNSFDNWGNKCHLFTSYFWEQGLSDQIPRWEVDKRDSEIEVSWDLESLKDLNCQYILSSFPLVHEQSYRMKLVKIKSMPIWDVHVYQLLIK